MYFLQQTLNALQLGSIYALIALGYTMVYGILTMINFAHGDLFMIGAFFCFLAATFLQLPFLPTLLVAIFGVALLGVLIERLAYKPLRQAPRVSAIITALGIGIFLENFTLALSPYPQHVPKLFAEATWSFGGISVSSLQLMIIVLSLALMVVLDFIVRKTMLGIAMRAVSWDKTVVPLMGVPVEQDYFRNLRDRDGSRGGGRDDVCPGLPCHRPLHGNHGRLEGLHLRCRWRYRQYQGSHARRVYSRNRGDPGYGFFPVDLPGLRGFCTFDRSARLQTARHPGKTSTSKGLI